MPRPYFEEIDRILSAHDGQTLTRVELGDLISPYTGSESDGHRFERNPPWPFIDRFVRQGRLIEVSEATYLVYARALEPLVEPGMRLRPSGLSD